MTLPLLKHAWNSLVHNARPCVLYVLCNVLAGGAYHACNFAAQAFVPEGQTPVWVFAYRISMGISLAAAASLFQAVWFAQLGKEIDKPLWKCPNVRDALSRFWLPWFIINLMFITLTHVQARFAEAEAVEGVLFIEFLIFLYILFSIPVGACIMYWGRLDWPEFLETISPLTKQFHLLISVLGLNFIQWVLYTAIGLALPKEQSWGLMPILGLINAPFALMECLVFAAMWQICIIHRNASYEQDFSDLGL